MSKDETSLLVVLYEGLRCDFNKAFLAQMPPPNVQITKSRHRPFLVPSIPAFSRYAFQEGIGQKVSCETHLIQVRAMIPVEVKWRNNKSDTEQGRGK